ncbi:uroporphyrinogen-III C-methyltransferase [Zwartia sp.]|uniref:uroporphyrinogen-III C-methyltransferase n=1 Tax=Zwartia sp. TaxID=2978004 RepID=UPI003BB176DC
MTETQPSTNSPQSAALLKVKKRASGPSWPISLALMFLVIALVAAGGVWFQQKRFENVGREVATQMQALANQVNDARKDATQALSLAHSQANRIAQLEQLQLESKSQYAALEQLWAGANKGIEDAMLANDVDRLLTTASQQLRLAGNVNNAIVTLEAAQSLLIRADRARFAAVQRALSLDLDRLRAVPFIDVPQLTNRLETLSALVARAPLILPDAAAPKVVTGASSTQQPAVSLPSAVPGSGESQPSSLDAKAWWEIAIDHASRWSKSFAGMVVREFAEVVSIQRVSDANALLMSPEQGALLRANLRTRVLTAQMALLMHQSPVWKTELTQIEQSLSARYDPKSSETVAALRLVKELSAIQIAVTLPDINASFAALESVRTSEPSPAGGQ